MNKVTLNTYEKMVGTDIGLSDWITVSQKMIDDFSDVTGDRQFIHNNPDRAANETPFGGAIAHGFLTLSLITQMYKNTTPIIIDHEVVINYGLNRIRFLAPVPSGARIRGRITLAKVEPRRDTQILTENKIVVEIENGEKPAMLGTWVTLLVKKKV
jgi:acyl dehydratase